MIAAIRGETWEGQAVAHPHEDGWVNAASGKPLVVRPTYWKVYVETLPRKKARERTPLLDSAPTGAPLTLVY